MFKQIYAQHGPEGMDQARFRTLWREHGQVASDAPTFIQHIRRNVQGDCLNDLPLDIGQITRFQGVAEIFYDDPAGRDAALSSEGAKEQLVPHAIKTKIFSAAPPLRIFGEETQWIPLEAKQGVKVHTFVRRREGLSDDAFAKALKDSAEALLDNATVRPLLIGFSQTRAADPGDFQAADELTFASVEDLEKAWTALAKDGVARADQSYADPEGRAVIVVSINVLHDDRKAA